MDLESYLTFEFGIAALAGLIGAYDRGFTGFGANLIWAPALVTVMNPVQAVAIMGIVGLFSSIQIVLPIIKDVNWNETCPIVISAWFIAPFGVWVLYGLDAENVRKVIGIFILIIAFILLSGWRYRGDRTGIKGRLAQITTGGIAGWLSGFGSIGGPIPVLYFMSSSDHPSIQRANNIIAVCALIPMVLLVLIFKGAINEETLIQSAILFIPVVFGTWLGARSFRFASPTIFRKVVLTLLIIIGTSALIL